MARDVWDDKTPQGYFDRATILWTNAHRTLRTLKPVNGFYRKPKRMREASSTGWLAVNEAIKGLARRQGIPVKKLPKEIDQLGQALAAESAIDGKSQAELHVAYSHLHITGYYEGERAAFTIQTGMEAARSLIQRITGAKLPLNRRAK